MGFKLPGIDGMAFSKGLAIKRGARGIAKFLDMVGPDTCRKLVESKTPLSKALPPEQLEAYKQLAQQWHWVANLITDEEFAGMMPPWFLEIVANTTGGPSWFWQQVRWLRSLFVAPVDR